RNANAVPRANEQVHQDNPRMLPFYPWSHANQEDPALLLSATFAHINPYNLHLICTSGNFHACQIPHESSLPLSRRSHRYVDLSLVVGPPETEEVDHPAHKYRPSAD